LEPRRAFWDEAYILGNLKADNGASCHGNPGLIQTIIPAGIKGNGKSEDKQHHSGTTNPGKQDQEQYIIAC
jgi:hypothetical protein